MNYHSDDWIMDRLQEHYKEALNFFPEDRIVGLFLQGSQNYQMDTENSDIDTKLIVLPTFEDICFNRKPVSTTHIRENNEHIDFKDIRLMFQTFRKQNVNFIEILFTKYKILNPRYEKEWQQLINNNELIAHYSPYKAVATMKGIALEKYYAMEHLYPSKIDIIEKYGYDPKQLHHLIRIAWFLHYYTDGAPYDFCLHFDDATNKIIVDEKTTIHSLDTARLFAEQYKDYASKIADTYREKHKETIDPRVDELLDKVQHEIMHKAISIELMKGVCCNAEIFCIW